MERLPDDASHRLIVGCVIGLVLLACVLRALTFLARPSSVIFPGPTPIASLSSLTITSEEQPDGTVKNSASLSIDNSLGVGELSLTAPAEMNLQDSALVRLCITPDDALVSLSSVAVPTQNPQLPPRVFSYTDKIGIYPIMQAELIGAGFEIASDDDPQKAIVSDRPVEWVWIMKPKSKGTHSLTVVISIPVLVDGSPETISTHTLKDIPVEIKVTKSPGERAEEIMPWLIPALLAFIAAIVGVYANYRLKRRDQRVEELEEQITQSDAEKDRLREEIERLHSIPRWQFWRR